MRFTFGVMIVYQQPSTSYTPQAVWPPERHWLRQLPRRGWAWEFLRRNGAYQADYYRSLAGKADPAPWGLLRFCDPIRDALTAPVLWRPEDSPEVLPLTVGAAPGAAVMLDLGRLPRCAVRRFDAAERRHDLLLGDGGRFLQLAIFGEEDVSRAGLLMSALGDPAIITARTVALRRLNDVLYTRNMRPSLYPAENRAQRLANVLAALDGSLHCLPQREIAVKMFGPSRTEREWNHPNENLRDQVRRAVAYGQELMKGGYRQFLRLTFARRIGVQQGARSA